MGFYCGSQLIFGEIGFHPPFNLTNETAERLFSRGRGEVGLARIIERAGIILEFFGELLVEKIAGAIKRKIKLRDRPIGAAALAEVIIQGADALDMLTEYSAHEQRIVAHILSQRALPEDFAFTGMLGCSLRQYFQHTVHFSAAAGADPVQVIRARKVGENVGDILSHGRVVDSKLPKTLAHGFEKKTLQTAVGYFIFHRSNEIIPKLRFRAKKLFLR